MRSIGHGLFIFLYPIAIISGLRKRFAVNIATVLQKNPEDTDVKKIARRSIHNWVMNITEIFYFYHPKRRKSLERLIHIDGLEKIEQLKKNGRGVIGVSAHFGNFPLMIFRLNIENVNMSYLFKEVEQPSIASAMREYIDKIGLNVILTNNQSSPTHKAIQEINNSGFVIFIADEFKKSSGVDVTFFDISTMQAVGPSVISLKTKAPILPVFIIREKRSRHRIVIEDPIHCDLSGNFDTDIFMLTQKRMDIFEKYINRYPDLWLWVHSRWKDSSDNSAAKEVFLGHTDHIN